MKNMSVFIMFLCLTACVTTSPDSSHAKQEKFVRYEGVKQKLYYPAGFYSYDAQRAQDRSARAWWNQ
jgi:hypothetical protein